MSTPNTLETRVALAEKGLDNITALFVRFELVIEKNSEISGQLKEMLAVHEQRLQMHEKTASSIYEQLERRKDESTSLFEKINDKIVESVVQLRTHMMIEVKENYMEVREALRESIGIQKDLVSVLNTRIDTLVKARDEQFNEMYADHEKLDTRVHSLENWRWVLVGGGTILGAIIGSYNTWSKLFT